MTEGWITAPLPDNEAKRLEALYRYNILDTLPEAAFDRITRLVSSILKTPMALVSLVDKDRQWFKSHHGIDATETPRELAFCAHAILKNEILLVPDATKDQRFFANPLVKGAPDIRFYAGAPLTTPDGYNLGTLCAIDQKVHNDFDEYHLSILSDLAAMVIDELEFHIAVQREKVANRAKSTFLANMSHEIRTPMNGVLGIAGLLFDTKLEPAQKELVDIIRKSGDSLLEIVNDILDISKIEAGELTLEAVNFNLHNSIEDIVALLKIKASEQKVELRIDLGNTPKCYIGDVGRVRQILLNLISNSVKFTNNGYVALKVRHEDIDGKKARLFFEVEDNGIGIPEDKLDYIFNKFTQAEESTTRKFGGTGLGLAICKNLTHMMEGSIGVKSTLGKCSTFYFDITLPYGKFCENDEPKNNERAMFPGVRALAVDDMKLNMMLVVKILEKHGCIADTAANGLEALQAVNSLKYDIVFMDCHMPEMDGYEATRAIRILEEKEARKHLPIVAITADAMTANKQRCIIAGMDDYLNKPVKESQIEEMLKKWVCSGDKSLAEKKILVVEDNVINQMVIKAILEEFGCIVDIAEDGLVAVNNAKTNLYDAILMDFHLPKLSGLEAIKIIREDKTKNSSTPIITITAADIDEIKKEITNNSNITDFLTKPINKEQVRMVLRKCIFK
jgi:signal transduction histidine kinase/CheY-like chemotaxis protein